MAFAPVLTHYTHALLDFVFPRVCCGCEQRVLEAGRLVCTNCVDSVPDLALPICSTCGCPAAVYKAEGRCADCPAGQVYMEWARGVWPYQGVAKTIVERLKYHEREEYAQFMAARMFMYLQKEFDGLTIDRIVPVPLHKTRQRERGFNQSLLIANRLGKYLGVPVDQKLLTRPKPTPSQTRLTRHQRARNIRGAFDCAADACVGAKLLLVDDVYTTGATLNECANMLKTNAKAAEVVCLAFARAALD